MDPSLFAGVGTEMKTKSESFTVSESVCVESCGLISKILISALKFLLQVKPYSTAVPTNPLPMIPIFTLIKPFCRYFVTNCSFYFM